ncbi:unnamed protein product [Lactuca virosa]|uniref:Uncharacterized protein n=1 Tax=Lactuca virosa TaxID=75947 RepID=A0AAU9MZ51_9ASTR|nr:unnamed protein product [Lactuca virosa]
MLVERAWCTVGFVIVGTKSFIASEEFCKKLWLGNDHKNAKTLAEGLNKIKGLKVDVASVETNIEHANMV